MIVETAIVCATVVVVASLRTAVKLTPKTRLTKEAIEEKRRILERGRKELFITHKDGRMIASGDAVSKIDEQLLALADEEREP